MCNAYSLRRSREELVQLGNHWRQLPLAVLGDPPDWEPRYRIGPRQRGLILRPQGDGQGVAWSLASWGLIPPGSKAPTKFTLTNARDDKLFGWPWSPVVRQGRCIVLCDGFYEPEKPARTPGKVPWSYYQRLGGGVFGMAGLVSEAQDPETGEVTDTYTVVTTAASPVIREHDRMPVIVDEADWAAWLAPGEPPAELLRPYPAERMEGWRVPDAARSSRGPDHPGLITPVEESGPLL